MSTTNNRLTAEELQKLRQTDFSKKPGFVKAETVLAKKALGEEIDCSYEETAAAKLSSLTGSAYQKLGLLRAAVEQAEEITDAKELAMFYKDAVLTAMEALRGDVDALESITSAAYWPYPSCGELLFGIR